jgi:hypothetical protein
MPVKMRIIAFAKNFLIGLFIPIRIMQTMGSVEMFFPENGDFVCHDAFNKVSA